MMNYIKTIAMALLAVVHAYAWESDFRGMPYYTGTVLPTPQQANYHDGYMSLDNTVAVLGQGLLPTDPRLGVLRHRVEEMGGSLNLVSSLAGASGYSAIIAIGDVPGLQAPRPLPARDEGYIMAILEHQGQDVILLQGSDDIGLLWAIVSLNQLITRIGGEALARKADLWDYPVHPLRGYISGWGSDAVEDELWYIVNFKMNNVLMRRFQRRDGAWREPQPEAVFAAIARTGELLTPLGIGWYDGFRPVHRDPELQLNIAGGEDFEIVVGHARRVVEAGGNFNVHFDDHRFPIHVEDMERFGNARTADMYFLEQLYGELTGIRPDVRMLFCPPFYWGPHAHNPYPESREDYLAALSALPDTVDVFWTGPQVKGEYKTAEEVRWITNLIDRKPTVWQNRGWTPHVFNMHYHTDPITAWIDWHYDGFFDEVAAYMPNTHMPDSAAAVLTLIDYLWNPGAYDPERSAREVAMKLTGPESYELMVAFNEALTYFDQYNYRQTPAAARNLPEMEKKLETVKAVWAQIQAKYGERVNRWTNLQRYPSFHERFVTRLKERPSLEFFAEMEDTARTNALEDGVDIDDARDVFLSAQDFEGAKGPSYYDYRSPRRPASWVQGGLSTFAAMEAGFELDPFPPAGNYTLILSGQDNDRGDMSHIRIRVNDTVIYEGPNNFERHGWSLNRYIIPASALDRRYSRITVEGADEVANSFGPPWFMVNYAVLKPEGAE